MNDVEQVPYDDRESAYQREQAQVRDNRRIGALEVELEKLKAELEKKNTRLNMDGPPVPYTRRKYGDFSR